LSVTETTRTLPRFDGGSFECIEACSGARGPGLVVISSVYGHTGDLRATMRRFAASGFVVAAPEMFSRTEGGALGQSEEERAKARGRLDGFDFAAGMKDVAAAMEALRARPDCTGAVAVMGYCFGGEFAYVATVELGAAAAASFHGINIEKHADLVPRINVPMSLHFGEADRFAPPPVIDEIEAAHRGKPGIEIYRYPGAAHGFAQSEAAAYDPEAARLSEERTLAMLERLK
jgi:carboxymethylenebutenolidase